MRVRRVRRNVSAAACPTSLRKDRRRELDSKAKGDERDESVGSLTTLLRRLSDGTRRRNGVSSGDPGLAEDPSPEDPSPRGTISDCIAERKREEEKRILLGVLVQLRELGW